MFRIMIAGKTVGELKTNIQEYLNALGGEQIIAQDPGQLSLAPFVAPPPIPVPSFAFPETPSVDTGPKEQVETYIEPVPAPSLVRTPVSYDSRGMIWDARIHSATKATNKDGSWRTRRGVEPLVVSKIESELMAQAGQTKAPTPQVDVLPAVPHVVQPAPVVVPTPTVQVVATPPPMPSPGVQTSAHSLETFKANLVPTLARMVADGKLTQEYINSLKTYFGVDQIWLVNDQQLNEMFENFVNAGLVSKVG